MTRYAHFVQLGLLASTHWLLTCTLGAVLQLAEALAIHPKYLSLPTAVDQARGAFITAVALTWPLVFGLFVANLWVVAAQHPRQRAGRLLLALVVGGALATAALSLLVGIMSMLTREPPTLPLVLRLAWPWLLASFLAAGWLYRPWLRPVA